MFTISLHKPPSGFWIPILLLLKHELLSAEPCLPLLFYTEVDRPLFQYDSSSRRRRRQPTDQLAPVAVVQL